jgi:hypothetical protein
MVLAHLNHYVDMDDQVSVVLSALAVVGDGKLVSGVNGEVRRRPGGGDGFLHSGLGPYLLGGHGIFVIVPDCILVIVVFIVTDIVAISGALFTIFCRMREGNMIANLDINMK